MTRFTIITAAFLAIVGSACAQPVIDSLNGDAFSRSGRVAITGSGFGARGGADRVEVGGIQALLTTWTDTRIVAYVPEGTPIGAAEVRVVADGEQSNALPIEVSLRERDGRVKWTFETDGDDQWFRPALAPDGTLYLHVSGGFVYAISPDGALEWISHAVWFPYIPPTAGPDGSAYFGSISTVTAVSATGETLWTYTDGSSSLVHAVTAGPDGELYGACEYPVGAFSLAGNGQHEWANPGDPIMLERGLGGHETKFGPAAAGGPVDQVYIGTDNWGDNHIYAFGLDGEQRWAVPAGPNARGAEPAIGADGALYTPDFGQGGSGWVLRALHPSDGRTLWVYDGGFISACTDLEIGPDDTLYYARDIAHLEAFAPHAQTLLWHTFIPGTWLKQPAITPDGGTLVVAGYLDGGPGFVDAYGPSDGQLRWSVPLPGGYYPDERLVPADQARVTPDGSTAYVSTTALSRLPGDPRAVLFAIDLTDGCAGDFNGDGAANTLDVLAFLNAWSSGDPRGDFNGDGAINTLDVLAFLNAWGAGC
ncbi:MAG: PQQ-binding-like beta-propeller repeat protein [Phycisphaerales bacterium]|nr:PQQ-binding-like beta-propeller repeat protein [Phycisphaerales bacterium]